MDSVVLACSVITTHFGLSLRAIEGHSREWRLVWARWCIWFLLRRRCQVPHRTLEILFNRKEGAIAHAMRALRKQIRSDPKSAAELRLLDQQFLSRL